MSNPAHIYVAVVSPLGRWFAGPYGDAAAAQAQLASQQAAGNAAAILPAIPA